MTSGPREQIDHAGHLRLDDERDRPSLIQKARLDQLRLLQADRLRPRPATLPAGVFKLFAHDEALL